MDQTRKPSFGRKFFHLCETANSVQLLFLNYLFNFWLELKSLCKVQQKKIPLKRFKSSVLLGML
jgi:hypothetical protein